MDFLWTTEGLTYNLPALACLAWLLWRRWVLGIIATGLVYLRVFEGEIPFSMHAFVSGAALVALPRWERLAGLALAIFTAWYYLGAWDKPRGFWIGLGAGMLIGLLSVLGRALWTYVSE
jgi:hypothetical protein